MMGCSGPGYGPVAQGGGSRSARSDRGAATLETAGMFVVAAAIVAAVIVPSVPAARTISETYSYWICQVVTAGQGSCSPPSTSAEAHKPTEPCTVSQNGIERNSKVSVLVFTLENGRRIEVEELSNDEYRVTVTDGGGAGVETGVGGGLTVTVNDHTVGGKASASAGASLDIKAGEVYYADEDGLEGLMQAVAQDQLDDAIAGDGGVARWALDRGEALFGANHELPEPDEVYAEGGISLNASAEATGLTSTAKAGVDAAKMLGVRTNRDGTRTVYLRSTVSGEAGLRSLGVDTEGNPDIIGAEVKGSAEVVNAVTFDENGTMVNVQATAVASGSSAGMTTALFGGEFDPSLSNQVGRATAYQTTLPIKDEVDQDVANRYLLSLGVGELNGWQNPMLAAEGYRATQGFMEAAAQRGTLTEQDYDTSSNTIFGVDGSGKLGVELGVQASVAEDSMSTTGAQYWDGTQWVEWEECSG